MQKSTQEIAAQDNSWPRVIATRVFRMKDQREFAEFSGDFNPMHLDALTARRTQMGAPVVHGVHQLLWGLENLAGLVPTGTRIVGLQARFAQPLYLDESAELSVAMDVKSKLRLAVRASVVATMKVVFELEPGEPDCGEIAPGELEADCRPGVCRIVSFEEMSGLAGDLPVCFRGQHAERLFPEASRVIGAVRVHSIATLSRLVGMECPGLNSILSSIRVRLGRIDENRLRYSVLLTDRRFSFVRLRVTGGGMKGEAEASMRTAPVRQPDISEIREFVREDEFSGSVALVIGASRGVGQFVAKAIGAGGGHVLATYCVCRAECEQVASEVLSAGGRCDVLQYDTRRSPAEQLAHLPAIPTSLYYFATPKIFGRPGELFERVRLNEFLEVYVDGFYSLCSYLRRSVGGPLTIFYPSSVAVESRPGNITAYAMAKAAGEVLCDSMAENWRGFRLIQRRLPRLITDQTATLVEVDSVRVIDTMLPIISEVESSVPSVTSASS